jgi:hypothetical protein
MLYCTTSETLNITNLTELLKIALNPVPLQDTPKPPETTKTSRKPPEISELLYIHWDP